MLEQQFQVLSGTLQADGKTIPIGDGRLRGDQISFQAGGTRYSGRVAGASIEGTARTGAQTFGWTASPRRSLIVSTLLQAPERRHDLPGVGSQ